MCIVEYIYEKIIIIFRWEGHETKGLVFEILVSSGRGPRVST